MYDLSNTIQTNQEFYLEFQTDSFQLVKSHDQQYMSNAFLKSRNTTALT